MEGDLERLLLTASFLVYKGFFFRWAFFLAAKSICCHRRFLVQLEVLLLLLKNWGACQPPSTVGNTLIMNKYLLQLRFSNMKYLFNQFCCCSTRTNESSLCALSLTNLWCVSALIKVFSGHVFLPLHSLSCSASLVYHMKGAEDGLVLSRRLSGEAAGYKARYFLCI